MKTDEVYLLTAHAFALIRRRSGTKFAFHVSGLLIKCRRPRKGASLIDILHPFSEFTEI